MRRLQSYRDIIAVFAGVTMPIVIAIILVPFRKSFATTAAALVLVTVVVAVAANGNRVAGYVAAISASLWFDFFLTPPYQRFAMTNRPDIETAICLLVVGFAVTELAARNRRHHQVAIEETDYVGLVYYLSELVASGAPAVQVIERANAELSELLHLRECRYDAAPAEHDVTRIEHDGTVKVGNLVWGAQSLGLPGNEQELLVQSRGYTHGRFAMSATPGSPVSLQRRLVAVAIADQVGASLHRNSTPLEGPTVIAE